MLTKPISITARIALDNTFNNGHFVHRNGASALFNGTCQNHSSKFGNSCHFVPYFTKTRQLPIRNRNTGDHHHTTYLPKGRQVGPEHRVPVGNNLTLTTGKFACANEIIVLKLKQAYGLLYGGWMCKRYIEIDLGIDSDHAPEFNIESFGDEGSDRKFIMRCIRVKLFETFRVFR